MNVIEDHTSLARSANITPQAHHAPAGRIFPFIAEETEAQRDLLGKLRSSGIEI